MTLKAKIGENLYKEIRQAGITQSQLAANLGVGRESISVICRGKASVSLDRIDRIAKVLDIAPASLFLDDDDRNALELGRHIMRDPVWKDLLLSLQDAPERKVRLVAELLAEC